VRNIVTSLENITCTRRALVRRVSAIYLLLYTYVGISLEHWVFSAV